MLKKKIENNSNVCVTMAMHLKEPMVIIMILNFYYRKDLKRFAVKPRKFVLKFALKWDFARVFFSVTDWLK